MGIEIKGAVFNLEAQNDVQEKSLDNDKQFYLFLIIFLWS